jgi:hypothetical protein
MVNKYWNPILIFGVLMSCLAAESRTMGKNRDDTDKDDTDKDEIIIVPGGPRPRSKVHTIEPGEHLQINPDGTYSIVPDRQKGDEETAPGAEKTK